MLNAITINGDYARPPVEQFGYTGAARYVAFWWESIGDELAWSDSRGWTAVGMGDNWAFLQWPGRKLWPCGAFGASDMPGHALSILWDRETGRVSIYAADSVARFLERVRANFHDGNGEQC